MSFATLRFVKQVGVTVVGDGEMSKPSYVSYVNERSKGFSKTLQITPSLIFLGLRALVDLMWDLGWQTWQITLALPSSRFC